MRSRKTITIPAGANWPECEPGSFAIPEGGFSWLHIENRSAAGNDVIFGLAPIPDTGDYYAKVVAGGELTCNVAGPKDEPGRQLCFTNLGAAAATLSIVISDTPIVFIRANLAPA